MSSVRRVAAGLYRTTGAAFLILVSSSAVAESSLTSWRLEPYIGGSAGVATDHSDYALPSGATKVGESASAPGAALFAGLRFGPYFGVELSTLALGRLGVEASTPGGSSDTRRALDVTSVNLVGFIPLGTRWEITLRAGLALNASYRTGETCYGRSGRYSGYRAYPCSETSTVLGLGVRYALDEDWGIRLDWLTVDYQDRREGPNYRPQFFGIGVDYRF